MNTNVNICIDEDSKRQFEIGDNVPNAETVEAIQEVRKMKENPGLGKTYSNVDVMMEELLSDV